MTDREQVEFCRKFLRRRYKTLPELEALESEVWEAATREVTFTANSFEGASASGQITFDRKILLVAVQSLIADLVGDDDDDEKINTTHHVGY